MADAGEELVRRCIEGDQRAWSSLVDQYARLVYSISRAFGLREDQCDDVAQSVFLALTRGLPELKDPGALRFWIGTTARREAGRVRRAAARRAGVSLSRDPVAPEAPLLEAAERAERLFEVQRAMEGLGERCRRLLEALYMQKQTPEYQSLAEALGMPVGSIGPTRLRCLAKLAELLEDADGAGAGGGGGGGG